jgi:hypothetical protein
MVVAEGEAVGEAVVHAGAEVVALLWEKGVVGVEPGFVVVLGMARVGAKYSGNIKILYGGECVDDEAVVEVCCLLWCEGGCESAFGVSWCGVFDEEEEALCGVGDGCFTFVLV